MWTAKADSLTSERKFKAMFETSQEAIIWADKQREKNSWGKGLRQAYRDSELINEDLVISEEVISEGGVDRVLVTLSAEYTYEIKEIDITADDDDAKEERLRIAKTDALVFKKFRDFGVTVELYFTKLINDRPITQDQKNSIQSHPTVIALITQLRFGRIAAVRKLADTIEVDNKLFFKEDIDKVNKLMDDFLTQL